MTYINLTRLLAAIGIVSALSACTANYRNHGYVPADRDLQEIIVGIDNRDSVSDVVGRPTSMGVLRDGNWYYVQSRWRHYAYKAPQEVERQVVAIRFENDGTVANIERFTLEDGNVVPLTRRVTDSSIADVSFIRQLLGNIGNIDAGQFLN